MGKPLTYYFDEKYTKKVPVNEEGNAIIDWGEVIPGQKKTQELYILNESRDRAVLRQPYSEDEDLTIKDYPPNLMGQEKGRKVVLEFAPKQDRIDGHHARWGFDVILG